MRVRFIAAFSSSLSSAVSPPFSVASPSASFPFVSSCLPFCSDSASPFFSAFVCALVFPSSSPSKSSFPSCKRGRDNGESLARSYCNYSNSMQRKPRVQNRLTSHAKQVCCTFTALFDTKPFSNVNKSGRITPSTNGKLNSSFEVRITLEIIVRRAEYEIMYTVQN